MLRFGRTNRRFSPRHQNQNQNQKQPHLVRLIVLMGLSLVAIVVLRWQSQQGSVERAFDPMPRDTSVVETALTPPSSPALAEGVIVAGLTQASDKPDASETAASSAGADDTIPVVNQQLMASVLDKTKRISPRAYYHLVDLSTRTSSDVLERNAKSEQEITLAHLATEPEKYRGQLIHLKGRLRGLIRFDATDDKKLNPTGLVHLYQGDLFTPQAHPYPYVIIMPSVPDGMPQGMDLSENVTFVGYFLQLWRYTAPGRVDRVAPVLVGRMVTWTPAAKVDSTRATGMYLAIAITLMIVGLGASVWALNRRPKSSMSTEPHLDSVRADLARLERKDGQD